MKLKHSLLLFMLSGLIFMNACTDQNLTEQENITTIKLLVTGPGFDQTFTWNDSDGPGGNAPVIDEIVLPASTTGLQCAILVSDESQSPAVDYTAEISAENTAHLFAWTVSGGASLTITGADQDAYGKPFSQITNWVTGQSSTGFLNVKLYHEPTEKTNSANPGGEVDFDIAFPVKIQ
ncbi:MAG: hypothetical protein ACKOCH_05585 [Bacteroidota bacterium]